MTTSSTMHSLLLTPVLPLESSNPGTSSVTWRDSCRSVVNRTRSIPMSMLVSAILLPPLVINHAPMPPTLQLLWDSRTTLDMAIPSRMVLRTRKSLFRTLQVLTRLNMSLALFCNRLRCRSTNSALSMSVLRLHFQAATTQQILGHQSLTTPALSTLKLAMDRPSFKLLTLMSCAR